MIADVVPALHPLLRVLRHLDLSDRASAEETLRREVDGADLTAAREALLDAYRRGALTPKQASPEVAFGRVARPSEETLGFSVDAVDIAGAGAAHTHPSGEVSLCLPLEGAPVFEGAADGWVVLPPGSRHVPRVTGGRMLIVYFLPGGAVAWDG